MGQILHKGSKREIIRKLESLYIHTDNLGDVFRFELPCRACGAHRSEQEPSKCKSGHPMGESRGLGVWDESHNDVGNRSWNESGRATLLKGASQLRKMGYTFWLVTQHEENTDKNLRRVCGWKVKMTNMRERVRVLGMRVLPLSFFVASYIPANDALTTIEVPQFYERFFLRWDKRLYDSWGIYSGLYDELSELGDRIQLPPAGKALPARQRGSVVLPSERSGRWWTELEGLS